MRLISRILALAVCLFLAVSAANASDDAAAPNSIQQKVIDGTGLATVVPGYVPKDFGLQTVVARADTKWTGYLEIYQSLNGCFGVEATSGGIGGVDVPQAHQTAFTSPLGESSLFVLFKRGAIASIQSDWLIAPHKGGFFMFLGVQPDDPDWRGCKNVSVPEALRIAASLHVRSH